MVFVIISMSEKHPKVIKKEVDLTAAQENK